MSPTGAILLGAVAGVLVVLGVELLEWLRIDDPIGAVAEYRRFLGDSPPSALVVQASPEIRAAFEAAGLAVPAGLSGG